MQQSGLKPSAYATQHQLCKAQNASATDIRRSFNGLALLVQEQFELPTLDTHLFMFFNCKADSMQQNVRFAP